MQNYLGRPGRSFTLATGTTALANDGTGSNPATFTSSTKVVRLVASVATFVNFGAAATADSGIYLPPNVPEYFFIVGSPYVSALLSSGTGTLSVTEMSH